MGTSVVQLPVDFWVELMGEEEDEEDEDEEDDEEVEEEELCLEGCVFVV